MHRCQFEFSPCVSLTALSTGMTELYCASAKIQNRGYFCPALVATQVEAGGSISRGVAGAVPRSGQCSLLQ